MKSYLPEILAMVSIIIAVLGLIHQQLVSNDVWFHFHQLKNHETIISCLLALAIGLVAGKYLGKTRS